jgi:hypothetical protein
MGALNTFNDFVNVTGPAYLTSARALVNEAVDQSYILSRFLKGSSDAEVLQGGKTIKDTIMFDEQSTWTPYQPNDTFTWQNPQVTTEWEINWRFYTDHMAWTDQEVELNIGSGLSRTSRHQAYKDLKFSKEQRLATSIVNGMEAALWRQPETADMEAAAGKHMYSIPAFLNENTNGLFYSGYTPTGKTPWTTVEGINPTVETKWVPQTETYNSVAVNNSGNIISNFDQMWVKVKYINPGTYQNYFEDTRLFKQFIATSHRGLTEYQKLLRQSQDTFVTTGRQDPAYTQPKYSGIDVLHVTQLNTATLYGNSTETSAYVAEVGATTNNSGPRYYWLNGNYIRPVFHTSRYMMKHDAMRHPNQPYTTVVPTDTWCNMVCRSRQRLGIVSPSGNQYT